MAITDMNPKDIRSPSLLMNIIRGRAIELIVEKNANIYSNKGDQAYSDLIGLEQSILCLEELVRGSDPPELYNFQVQGVKSQIEKTLVDREGVGDMVARRKLSHLLLRWLGLINQFLLPAAGLGEARKGILRMGFYDDAILRSYEEKVIKEREKEEHVKEKAPVMEDEYV